MCLSLHQIELEAGLKRKTTQDRKQSFASKFDEMMHVNAVPFLPCKAYHARVAKQEIYSASYEIKDMDYAAGWSTRGFSVSLRHAKILVRHP